MVVRRYNPQAWQWLVYGKTWSCLHICALVGMNSQVHYIKLCQVTSSCSIHEANTLSTGYLLKVDTHKPWETTDMNSLQTKGRQVKYIWLIVHRVILQGMRNNKLGSGLRYDTMSLGNLPAAVLWYWGVLQGLQHGGITPAEVKYTTKGSIQDFGRWTELHICDKGSCKPFRAHGKTAALTWCKSQL